MMKKRILAILLLAAMAVGCILVSTASDTEAGGYSYLDEKGQIDPAGYFSTDGAKTKVKEDRIDFVMSGKEAEVVFNKPLASDNFQLVFAGVKDNTIEKIEFWLTDAENESETIKITYSSMTDTQTSIIINNAYRSFVTTGSLFKENDGNFSVMYSGKSNCFGDGMALTFPVLETANGDGFDGFSSQKVNLKVRLYGKSGSIFRLKSINQQRFGSKYIEDEEAPLVSVVNPLDYVVKGSKVTLPTAFATDVLADKATVTMSVLDPDGEAVSSTDGKKLEDVSAEVAYQIQIDKYGTYRVEFKATDGSNTTRSVVSRINVVDDTKPELTLKEEIAATYKQGDKLVFPEATCTDNISAAENIGVNVIVKHPCGIVKGADTSLVLEETGVYEITYIAVDEAGNVSRKTMETYVEEAENEKTK